MKEINKNYKAPNKKIIHIILCIGFFIATLYCFLTKNIVPGGLIFLVIFLGHLISAIVEFKKDK